MTNEPEASAEMKQVAEMIRAAVAAHEAGEIARWREQIRVLVREELDRIARQLNDRRKAPRV